MSVPQPAALWQQDGIFCVGLSAFHGELRGAARAQGFTWVASILLHDPAADGNRAELTAHAATFRAEGWSLCGWATFGQADTPENDARAAAELVATLGLDGWIANGEAWAEREQRDRSSRFIATWQETGCDKPLAVSCLSSDTANFPRDFDYAAWLAIGAAVMPQVYGNENAGFTVGACLANLKTGGVVPTSHLNLTFGTYGERPVPYADYTTWQGPRTVYTGGEHAARRLAEARAAARARPRAGARAGRAARSCSTDTATAPCHTAHRAPVPIHRPLPRALERP